MMPDVKRFREAEEYDDQHSSVHDCCKFEAPSPAQKLANWSTNERFQMSAASKSNCEHTHCTAPLMKEEQIVHGGWSQCHCHWKQTIEDPSNDQLTEGVSGAACKSCCEADCRPQEIDWSTSVDIRKRNPDKWPNFIDANRNSPTRIS